MPEPLIRLLAELPPAESEPTRAERTRARCRARLRRQAPRASTSPVPGSRGRTAQLWQPLIALLGVAYHTEVVVQTIRFYGMLPD